MAGRPDRYVDGFIVPVRKDRLDAYRALAETARDVWMEHGALDYVECLADDVKPGKVTSFPQSVALEPEEIVLFAWISYRSRRHRDEVVAKVMRDDRMKCGDKGTMPFDPERMIYGGFEVLVAASCRTA